MRVLVTGHKGYIGAVLVPVLLDDGIEVVGMDTDYYGECGFAGALAEVPPSQGQYDHSARTAEAWSETGVRDL